MLGMSMLTRKSFADITRRKGRSLLMVLGIFVGVVGVAATNEASGIISGAFFYANDATNVPNISFTVDRLPREVDAEVRQIANVARVQERAIYDNALWDLAGGGFATIRIAAYADPSRAQLDDFTLSRGRMPGRGEIVLESGDRAVQSVALGDTITIEKLDHGTVRLRVVGLARTRGGAIWPARAQALGYMSMDGLQQLAPADAAAASQDVVKGPPSSFGWQLLVKTRDVGTVEQTYQVIHQALDGAHITTFDAQYRFADADPDTLLFISGLLDIIHVLALVTLGLVGILIFNSIAALLAEQTSVIGMLKAIGSTRIPIMRSYLVTIGAFGLIATALGLDLGLIAGYQLAVWLAATTQQDPGPYHVVPEALASGAVVGLLFPLLAALPPLWNGTRITVREAISAAGVRTGRLPRRAWGHRLRFVPQIVWLGLRNLARRPGRLVLTLAALALTVAIFMGVQLTAASLDANVAEGFATWSLNSDFRIRQDAAKPDSSIVAALQGLPGVARVEPFDPEIVTITHAELKLYGMDADTQLYQPQLVAGRWLQPHEMNALVVNDAAAQRLGLAIGQTVTVELFSAQTHQGEQAEWKIVGIVHELSEVDGSANPQGRQGLTFTTLDNLNALRRLPADAAERMWLRATDRSPQALAHLRGVIQQALQGLGLTRDTIDVQSSQELAPDSTPLPIIATLFDMMTLLVALVGAMSLAHTLIASVLARRREIGVLRSLGATGWRTALVFLIEGLALAGGAWLVGVALGPWIGLAFLWFLDKVFGPIDLVFHWTVVLTSLLLVVAIAVVASSAPALAAAGTRTRDSLRYE